MGWSGAYNEFPDECGLFYFAKALNYDEKNIGALFNIINSFNRHDLKKSYILSKKELCTRQKKQKSLLKQRHNSNF
mgnify:FL=1